MSTYVDTSGVYAIFDVRDPNHRRARETWERLGAAKELLVTSNYAAVETVSLLQSRFGHGVARRFLEDALSVIDVVWLDEALHSRAIEAWLASGRRQLSLVDCASFTVMRHRGLTIAFAFDSHFAEQGFTMVP